MAKIISEAFGGERRVELTQMQFGLHPPPELPMSSTWILQPRIGQPLAPNRYFSIAPLSTPDHVQMLHKLEAAALSA